MPTSIFVLSGSVFLVLVANASAHLEIKLQFDSRYLRKESPHFSPALHAAYNGFSTCSVCHIGGVDDRRFRNDYGQALQRQLGGVDTKALGFAAKSKNPAEYEAVLAKVLEALDDADKLPSISRSPKSPTFGDLIRAGHLPISTMLSLKTEAKKEKSPNPKPPDKLPAPNGAGEAEATPEEVTPTSATGSARDDKPDTRLLVVLILAATAGLCLLPCCLMKSPAPRMRRLLVSWFSLNWKKRLDELASKKGAQVLDVGIVPIVGDGATVSSSLFRVGGRVGSGMLRRSHRSTAASYGDCRVA